MVCWKCGFETEVILSMPKGRMKKGRVYNKSKSELKCPECNSDRLILSHTKKQGVYVDSVVPEEKQDGSEEEIQTHMSLIGSYFRRNYREERLKPPVPHRDGEIGRTRGLGKLSTTTKTTGLSR